MKDGLLKSAGRFTEATIYCVAPPPNRSPARPDNVKVAASWQSGLETPSGLRQAKLRLQLVSPDAPLARPKRGGLLPLEFLTWRRKIKDRLRKLTELSHDKWHEMRSAIFQAVCMVANRGVFV
jgi:hypothetical protein